MDQAAFETLDRVIHPRSVAVVGASAAPGKFGWFYLKALLTIGFAGRLYPINKSAGEILGLKTYPTLAALPEPPDLVVISIPAKKVPEALGEAQRVGARGAVVMSAGFSEDSHEGKQLEREVVAVAKKGIRVIGPNCFGTYSPKAGVTILPGSGFSRRPGPVGFFAQSGGFTADLGQIAMSHGVGFSAMVSYGNGADVNELDMLDYFARDPDTKIIAAYVEGVRDGRKFQELLGEVTPKKPVIIWKGGTSTAGARMVMSHTGSMGGEASVWDAVFRQTGVVRATGLTEMIDTLVAFTYLYPRAGRRIAVMGGGGALGVEACDLVEGLGLSIPLFEQAVQDEIVKHLPEFGRSAKNPVDTGNPLVPAEPLVQIMRIIARQQTIDAILVLQLLFHSQVLMRRLSDQAGTALGTFAQYGRLAEGAREIADQTGKPVIGVFPRNSTLATDEDMELEREYRLARDAFLSAGCASFPTVDRALRALAKVVRYQESVQNKK